MSFKYRFILSFVLLEIFFILLIVSINFVTINNSSKQLIKEKIESNISFIEQLIKVPISIYDLATLDNLVENSKKQKYINSIIILDKQKRVLSKKYDYKHMPLNDFLTIKEKQTVAINDETYEIRTKELYEDKSYIGSLHIIFDTSESFQFIKENRKKTLFIIFIEILISTLLSYIIGSRLTKMLTNLTQAAKDIGENKHPTIPYLDKKDEIGTLSKSMNKMQIDLKNRNTELQKQKNKLIESNKYKDDFLANMSHELKTPLNSINIISSVMAKNSQDTLDEKQIKNLNIINNSGNDLLLLINDILDISKIEAGELTIDVTSINIKQLVDNLFDIMNPIALNKKISLIKNIDIENEFIISDSKRIKQIVQNLLSNAIKFTSIGTVELKVKQDSENILIEVVDTGIGIPLNKIEHIFDRFKQVDGSTTRKYGGTGLGLAISKELSHLLGGELSVNSTINKGSTFKLTLPTKTILSTITDETFEINNTDSSFKEITNDIELFENNSSTQKVKIYLYNNNPVEFFSLIVELKKIDEIELIQIKTLDRISQNINTNDAKIIILDIDSNEFDLIALKKLNMKIIAISSKLEKCIEADILIKKPIDTALVIEEVISKKGDL